VRFLVDANLSPFVAAELGAAGHDAVHVNEFSPDQHARLLLANLDAIADELDTGAVVTFSRDRIRVRRLPIVRRT